MKLTDKEVELIQKLGDCFSDFVRLSNHPPNGQAEFSMKIHDLQQQVMARLAERAHPEIFNKRWE